MAQGRGFSKRGALPDAKAPCACCGQVAWWVKVEAERVCGICHPNATRKAGCQAAHGSCCPVAADHYRSPRPSLDVIVPAASYPRLGTVGRYEYRGRPAYVAL